MIILSFILLLNTVLLPIVIFKLLFFIVMIMLQTLSLAKVYTRRDMWLSYVFQVMLNCYCIRLCEVDVIMSS
jgi:hypothetical protein